MEPFGFDQLPEVLRLLFEKVERIELVIIEIQPQHDPQPKMLNINEAAAFLNITVAALYSLVSRKNIPVNKPGKRLYFDKNELTEWIRSGKRKTTVAIEQESAAHPAVYRRKFRH